MKSQGRFCIIILDIVFIIKLPFCFLYCIIISGICLCFFLFKITCPLRYNLLTEGIFLQYGLKKVFTIQKHYPKYCIFLCIIIEIFWLYCYNIINQNTKKECTV